MMPVSIGELSTTIETLPASQGEPGVGSAPADDAPFELRIEELRAIVRALVAEELERQLRRRSDCP
jgi:hypothetical protein